MSKPPLYAVPPAALTLLNAARSPDGEMLDPVIGGINAPRYLLGLLPSVYENFIQDQCHVWGSSMEMYAGGFLVCYAMQLHSSVKVRINFADPNSATPIVAQTILVGPSGASKSGIHSCILKPVVEWSRANYAAQAREADADKTQLIKAAHNYITDFSLERANAQQSINEGKPLVIAPEEISPFLYSPTNHVSAGYQQLADAINMMFDCSTRVSVRQGGVDTVPCPYYTNVFTCATPARFGQWEYLDTAQRDGFLGRFDMVYGSQNMNYPRDPLKHIPGAYEKWEESLLKLRGLRDITLVLPVELFTRWNHFVQKRKEEGVTMEPSSPGVASWLMKVEKRVMRYAAVFELLEYVEGRSTAKTEDTGKFGRHTVITISEKSMLAATALYQKFLLPQQIYFHDHLITGSEFGNATIHLFYRLLAQNITTITKEDFWGSKCLPFSLRGKSDFQRERFARHVLGHGWLVPAPGAQNREPNKGEIGSSRFDVVDGFHEKFAHRKMSATEYWQLMQLQRDNDF
jgi:hypothetical protein